MKRIIDFCIALTLVTIPGCFSLTDIASAQERSSKSDDMNQSGDYLLDNIYLAPEIAYVLPTDSDVKSTVFVGARVGYEIDRNWALEIESGWSRFGVENSIDKDLDINSVPVLGNVRFGNKADGSNPGWYTFAGVGWAWNDIDENRYDAELDDATLWQIGVGAETTVGNNNNIVFADVRYIGNTSDIEAPATVTQAIGQNADLNSVLFTLGIKF